MTAGPVAVTGLGVLSAIGADVPAFAAALRAGRSGVHAVPDPDGGHRLAAPLGEVDVAATVDGAPVPDPVRRAAVRLTRGSPRPLRAAVLAALQAWLDAGLFDRPLPADRVGVLVAGHNLTSAWLAEQLDRARERPGRSSARYVVQGQDTDHVGVLSELLGITGAGWTIGASSASGTVAVDRAARVVASGELDACLVVGPLTELDPLARRALAALGALAGGRHEPPACRPLDRRRDGFAPGEAAACVVLESPASAAARGRAVPVAVTGSASALGAHAFTEPTVAAEVRVMREALRRSGVPPDALDYVNLHATGTPRGDEAELAALREVLGPHAGRPWLNATKALAGHCLAGAGVLETVATVLQLRDGFVHPNPLLDEPFDPGLRYAGARCAIAPLRHALSNGFGFGGFNSSVVLSAR